MSTAKPPRDGADPVERAIEPAPAGRGVDFHDSMRQSFPRRWRTTNEIANEFGSRQRDHDESMVAGQLQVDFGSMATSTMQPRRRWAHRRKEQPVSSS